MKRFYCTVCKRIKRVRTPPYITLPNHINPLMREGQCNRHFSNLSNLESHSRLFASMAEKRRYDNAMKGNK